MGEVFVENMWMLMGNMRAVMEMMRTVMGMMMQEVMGMMLMPMVREPQHSLHIGINYFAGDVVLF